MPSDTEIAQQVQPKPIGQVADQFGIDKANLPPYGRDMAKVHINTLLRPSSKQARLILISATTPTTGGDFHAITTANNLLSALIDNHIFLNKTIVTILSFQTNKR